ncbi:hypothetical protein TPHA_0E03760 [Tetrapisispora phaffii CBS 4417]|uniref:LisH domain-containing protein n=1 Tax=Tetrapisispora phaffii (strain ATCC 24235 / CBS 4417 / NBRC 1672 / NRRL Y-8282 / UCD 70-5) TaxID=1071381 RepID=G8BU87_TETPH|nr:hypothetical protein TPHA_0E03760 [Tetrapisispora phaffii CBS 4417]CCE63465.1 hypothetical protein TPHA_0E03760 [Tetrapisispora phaffii CBS 4417]
MSISFEGDADGVDDKIFMPTYNSKRRRSKVSSKPPLKTLTDESVNPVMNETVGNVFDKVQLTKLLINTLNEMGFSDTAIALEKESGGVRVESSNVHQLIRLLESGKYEYIDLEILSRLPLNNKTSILNQYVKDKPQELSDRDEVIDMENVNYSQTLKVMNDNTDQLKIIVDDLVKDYNLNTSDSFWSDLIYLRGIVEILVLLSRQIFLELVLDIEDISTAVTFLRTIVRNLIKIWETLLLVKDKAIIMIEEGDTSEFTPDNILKEMTITLTSSNIVKGDPRSAWRGSKENSRKNTVELISCYIDPEDLVPKDRLITLLKQAIKFQRSQDVLNIIDEEYDEKNIGNRRIINLLQDSSESYNNLKFEEYKTLKYSVDEIWYLQFSPDGKYLASSSANSLYDRKIILYDVENDFKTFKVLGGNDQCILYLSFSPDSRYIVSCPFSEKANVYDLHKKGSSIEIEDEVHTLMTTTLLQPIHSFQITAPATVSTSPLNATIPSHLVDNGNDSGSNNHASNNSTPRSSNSENSIANVNANPPRIWCCDWFHTPSQQGRFVIGSPDREVVFYDINEGRILFRMSGTSSIRVKDVANYIIQPQLEKFPRVHDIKITEDDKNLILMTHQGHLEVYDLSKFPKKSSFSSMDSVSLFETFSLTRINRVNIEKKMTCISLPQITGSYDQVSSLVLVSLQCNELQLWDFKESILIQKFYGQKQEQFIIRSCFGYNNNLVASGSEDGKVYVWDRINGNIVGVLSGHVEHSEYGSKKIEKNCNVVSWNPTNKTQFASGGDDGYIKIWRVIKD